MSKADENKSFNPARAFAYGIIGAITGPFAFVAKYCHDLAIWVAKVAYNTARRIVSDRVLTKQWPLEFADFRFVLAGSLYALLCFAVWRFVPTHQLLFLAALLLSIPCLWGFVSGVLAEEGDFYAYNRTTLLLTGGLKGACGWRAWENLSAALLQVPRSNGALPLPPVESEKLAPAGSPAASSPVGTTPAPTSLQPGSDGP